MLDDTGQTIWAIYAGQPDQRTWSSDLVALEPKQRLCDFKGCGLTRFEVTATVNGDTATVAPGDSVLVGGGTLWVSDYRRMVGTGCEDTEWMAWVWSRLPACGSSTCQPPFEYCQRGGITGIPACQPMPDCTGDDACACLARTLPASCPCSEDVAGNVTVSCP